MLQEHVLRPQTIQENMLDERDKSKRNCSTHEISLYIIQVLDWVYNVTFPTSDLCIPSRQSRYT